MAKYIVMGFPHDHCKANGQLALTMRKEHECTTICQYDRTFQAISTALPAGAAKVLGFIN
jgi:hypothetical protein